MTWCIFIATNYSLLFIHKQQSGKTDSGLWEQPSYTLHWRTAEKRMAKGCLGASLYDLWCCGPMPSFPTLKSSSPASEPRIESQKFLRRKGFQQNTLILVVHWRVSDWSFFDRSSVLLCLVNFLSQFG